MQVSATSRILRARIFRAARVLLLVAPFTACGIASAEVLRWEGTLEVDLATLPPLVFPGSGVATVDTTSGAPQLLALRLAGGITGSGTIPITDPEVAPSLPSLRASATLGTGTLSPFWPVQPWPEPQLERGALPIDGRIRLCWLIANCTAAVELPLRAHSSGAAVGVGGTPTAGGFGALRVSIEAAPWTVYTASVQRYTTAGGTFPWLRTGWIHGPASGSSSVATTGGALQLVTPMTIRSSDGLHLPGFATLELTLLPEPSFASLLAPGVVLLIALAWSRSRRSRET